MMGREQAQTSAEIYTPAKTICGNRLTLLKQNKLIALVPLGYTMSRALRFDVKENPFGKNYTSNSSSMNVFSPGSVPK